MEAHLEREALEELRKILSWGSEHERIEAGKVLLEHASRERAQDRLEALQDIEKRKAMMRQPRTTNG